MTVFSELPAQITGPSVWNGREMAARQNEWLLHLSPGDVADLEQAARHYLSLGRDIGEITKTDFPLRRFNGHLETLKDTLINGIGFEVIRGLPVETYSQEMAAAIFCGVGAHLGSARSQNAQGHILGHVRDIGADANDPNTRIYQTHERQTFHTDSADIVGLLCLRDAKEGGDSLLVSAEAIYNRMRNECPDLLERLFDPIVTDRRGEVPEGMQPFMTIPPFNWHDGKLTVFYQRQYIDSAQRFPEAMRLTPEHVAALDKFDSLSNDPDLYLTMRLQPGDMQFVYNHSQLHDRTGFVDWPDPAKRRHLFRLWLSPDGDRELPDVFKQRYGSIEVGNRGGIITKGTRLHAPLD
ncbi:MULTISPECIES: TauD/TfdA family dioxygenase [unclassified Ruegeria]|uniref:TauD/TfdA family dioxygenase n=1 Tax=unclassified Ruegeria TaxID=2625375 RepID=UPI0014929FBE|nr:MULTISPECIES: TauD/TfdA family dioxygenase [unclassified Ruegeria]NOD47282.1 TauD/TfdA family dioxygenase [Ruegeria sp. HKCCD5849]NOD51605.1 TauD/TfdA family dioxygenase [Ruegeria sp. HKCCD5851]NOD69250.1 TauD/TfdA family dioxygenase [Ruegeria sp. HKCCD7303]